MLITSGHLKLGQIKEGLFIIIMILKGHCKISGTEIANIKVGDDPAVKIYAPAASINYSTTEHVIGLLWELTATSWNLIKLVSRMVRTCCL